MLLNYRIKSTTRPREFYTVISGRFCCTNVKLGTFQKWWMTDWWLWKFWLLRKMLRISWIAKKSNDNVQKNPKKEKKLSPSTAACFLPIGTSWECIVSRIWRWREGRARRRQKVKYLSRQLVWIVKGQREPNTAHRGFSRHSALTSHDRQSHDCDDNGED